MKGFTFDTGMLIAVERRKQRALEFLRRADELQITLTIPTPIIGEWWRGRTDAREQLLRAVAVEPLSEAVAVLAGEAIADVRAATIIDAYVMASAAMRGDDVLTSDLADLERLRSFFPNVRLFRV